MYPGEMRRREFLTRTLGFVGAAGLSACSKSQAATEFVCTDVGGLSDGDQAARTAAGYADRAPDPAHACDKCHQFLPAADGCGACKLLRGPVHPQGTCRVFAAKG